MRWRGKNEIPSLSRRKWLQNSTIFVPKSADPCRYLRSFKYKSLNHKTMLSIDWVELIIYSTKWTIWWKMVWSWSLPHHCLLSPHSPPHTTDNTTFNDVGAWRDKDGVPRLDPGVHHGRLQADPLPRPRAQAAGAAHAAHTPAPDQSQTSAGSAVTCPPITAHLPHSAVSWLPGLCCCRKEVVTLSLVELETKVKRSFAKVSLVS